MLIYRKTTIGQALSESLQDLKDKNELSSAQVDSIFKIFDEVIG